MRFDVCSYTRVLISPQNKDGKPDEDGLIFKKCNRDSMQEALLSIHTIREEAKTSFLVVFVFKSQINQC